MEAAMAMEKRIEIFILTVDELVSRARSLHDEGYRLVQICCSKVDESGKAVLELDYTFDKHYNLYNIRISIEEGAEIPSISEIFGSAFVYENEIHDLYGVSIQGISIDYRGNFYKTAMPHPFTQD